MTHAAAVETEILRDLMALVAHCADNGTLNGMPRQPGTLAVTTRGIAWVVTLTDVHGQRSIEAVSLTLDGALHVAAALVGAAEPPWVPLRRRGH